MRPLARKLALQVLFQHEFSPGQSEGPLPRLESEPAPAEAAAYAEKLIQGVLKEKTQIDSIIQSASPRWKIERMSSVDRNLLRLAVFEMRIMDEPTKPSIVINEAIELAKVFGSSESSAFVNGILDQILKETP